MKRNSWFYLLLLILSLMLVATNAFADPDDDSNDADDATPVTATATASAPVTQNRAADAIGNMLLQSVSLMGIPYRWGGNTPETGMDCSGFVRYVFKKSLGITLPRTANEMSKLGKRVAIDDLQPGDLLFFNIHHVNSHMGMYIGNNQFIQSPHTGDSIKITEFNDYWRSRLNGAKRMVQEDQDSSGHDVIEEYQDIDDEALPTRGVHSNASRHKKGRHGHHASKIKQDSSAANVKAKHKVRKHHHHHHHHVAPSN